MCIGVGGQEEPRKIIGIWEAEGAHAKRKKQTGKIGEKWRGRKWSIRAAEVVVEAGVGVGCIHFVMKLMVNGLRSQGTWCLSWWSPAGFLLPISTQSWCCLVPCLLWRIRSPLKVVFVLLTEYSSSLNRVSWDSKEFILGCCPNDRSWVFDEDFDFSLLLIYGRV